MVGIKSSKMRNLIYLLSGATLILGFIIGTTISDVCAQLNFPMCVTIYKYLVWPNFQSGVIPVASNNSGYLTSSPMYVSNNNDVVVRTGLTANNYVSSPYLVTKKLNAVDEIYTGGLIRGGAFQFMPRDSAPTNPQEGMMYYDKDKKAFLCYIKDSQGNLGWSTNCLGAGEPVPPTQISNATTITAIAHHEGAYTAGRYIYALYYNGKWHYPDPNDTECKLVSDPLSNPFLGYLYGNGFWCGNTRLYRNYDPGQHEYVLHLHAYCPPGYIRTGCSSATGYVGAVGENGCGNRFRELYLGSITDVVEAYCLKVK